MGERTGRAARPDGPGLPVSRAIAGDSESFGELMGAYHGRIFAMVYSRIMSRMDAEDITQDVFASAFRAIGTLRDPELFRPWLYRIAINTVNDFLRKKRLRSIFTLFSAGEEDREYADPNPEPDHLERKEFWKRLAAFFSRLPASEREVFRLKYLDGLSIREIAEVLSKNESTVKTHLYRGVEKFRREEDLAGLLEGKCHE
jgi:RNA polymerase sigma-70 factor (ECF subfamily)